MPCCWWSLQTPQEQWIKYGPRSFEVLFQLSLSPSLHPPAPPLILITATLSVWEKVADCEGNRNVSDVPVPSACDQDNEASSHRRRFSSQNPQKQSRTGYRLECGHKSTSNTDCFINFLTYMFIIAWTLGHYKTELSEPFTNWPPTKRHT